MNGCLEFKSQAALRTLRPLHGRPGFLLSGKRRDRAYVYDSYQDHWTLVGIWSAGLNRLMDRSHGQKHHIKIISGACCMATNSWVLAHMIPQHDRRVFLESAQQVYRYDDKSQQWAPHGAVNTQKYWQGRRISFSGPINPAHNQKEAQLSVQTCLMSDVAYLDELRCMKGVLHQAVNVLETGGMYEWDVAARLWRLLNGVVSPDKVEPLHQLTFFSMPAWFGHPQPSQQPQPNGPPNMKMAGAPVGSTGKDGLYCSCSTSQRDLADSSAGGQLFKFCRTCKKEYKA